VLSDGYLANGSEPWLIPDADKLPKIEAKFAVNPEGFAPYQRDDKTLSRPWAIPGTPGLEHRIGGLEKEHITGNVSYDPENHEFMVRMRQSKIDGIAEDIPPAVVEGDEKGDLLVVGWGGTYGAIRTAVEKKRSEGKSVSHLHLRHLNPFPKNLGEILYNYKSVVVAELNLGQLAKLLRAKYLVPAKSITKIQGLPFRAADLETSIEELL
jgi:2-oxoglutarate ferredoxin oxidoreductase subunit alpha